MNFYGENSCDAFLAALLNTMNNGESIFIFFAGHGLDGKPLSNELFRFQIGTKRMVYKIQCCSSYSLVVFNKNFYQSEVSNLGWHPHIYPPTANKYCHYGPSNKLGIIISVCNTF
jgi:hypothetical protein